MDLLLSSLEEVSCTMQISASSCFMFAYMPIHRMALLVDVNL